MVKKSLILIFSLLFCSSVYAQPTVWSGNAPLQFASGASVAFPYKVNVPFTDNGDGTITITGTGGGGSQTPWTTNINGGGFSLSNVNSASANSIFASTATLTTSLSVAGTGDSTFTGNVSITGTATSDILVATTYASAPTMTVGTLNYSTLNPAVSGSQTPWTSNINGANFSLSGVNSASANSVFASSTTVSGTASATNLVVSNQATAGYVSINNYLDMLAISNPSAPPSGRARFHTSTTQGFTRLEQDNEALTNLVLGRDNVFIAKNTSGSQISTGQCVYVTGSTGNVPNVSLARANSLTTLPAVGVALDTIGVNNFGQIMKSGILANFNTSAFSTGDRIWVSETAAGSFTKTRPVIPNYVQRVGSVLVSGAGNGSIDVSIAPFIGSEETGTNAGTWTATGNIQVINSASANSIFASSSTVSGTASSNILQANTYKSADGTSGGTTTTGGLTFKSGLYTSGSATGGAASGSVIGIFAGNGSAIATNQMCWARIPNNCTLTEWDLTAMATCPTLVIDVWKKTYSNFDPQASASIVGTNKPTLTAQIKNQSQSLSSWTTSLSAGDYIFFKVTNTDTATFAVVTLSYTK